MKFKIEGKNFPWNKKTITTEEIIKLGLNEWNLSIVVIDKDNNEHTLKSKEKIELKPGMSFMKKVRFRRGQGQCPLRG